MVGTFTTAYGIFKPLMADMDDMAWATAFSGALSQTVASFKTFFISCCHLLCCIRWR
jgi:hypothetical protein